MSIVDQDGAPVASPAASHVASTAVEMPPNKAIAAGATATTGGGVASIIVGLALHYFAPDTPPEIVGMWNALASALTGVLSGFLVYYMPHGAMVKEP